MRLTDKKCKIKWIEMEELGPMHDSERLYEGVYGPYRCAGPLKTELKFVRELPGACTYAPGIKGNHMRCPHLCHLIR